MGATVLSRGDPPRYIEVRRRECPDSGSKLPRPSSPQRAVAMAESLPLHSGGTVPESHRASSYRRRLTDGSIPEQRTTAPAHPLCRTTREGVLIGKLRYVVEQNFALLHHFKRLAIRWERRTELHDAFISLACSLICWRRLNKPEF